MSSGIYDDTKERIRQAVDIVDLIGSYLDLRRQGRLFVAQCPWHDDSRPSLQINPDRQSWKCWVCGNKGGDIFSFVMEREGVSFAEALQLLAERAGIELKRRGPVEKTKQGNPNDKPTLYQAAAWVEQQFHQCLLQSPEAEPARRYLQDRDISSDSIKRFHLGFTPNRWTWLLDRSQSTQFSSAVLQAINVIGKSEQSGKLYDRFRGRLMFPIRDVQRRPIAFGGRVLPGLTDSEPAKYINSSETRLFSKSDQLYGLDIVRDALTATKSRHVLVMEGYTDVVVAHQCGVDNAVAVLGTALNERHIRLLRRFADSITLVLDGDEAGQKRTNELLELFIAAQVDLRILTLPDGFDPCDYILKNGAEQFRQFEKNACDALEHKIRIETRNIDLVNDSHRASVALESVLQAIAKAPRLQTDTTQANRLREQQLLSRMARSFRVGETEVRARLAEIRKSAKNQQSSEVSDEPKQSQAVGNLPPKERELLEILVLYPEMAERALDMIAPNSFESELARTIYETYIEAQATDGQVQFTHILTRLEEPQLKNFLVELDESAHAKEPKASEDAESRLDDIIRYFRQKEVEPQKRENIAALDEKRMTEEEELAVLQQLFKHETDRQGISEPTDG